MRLVEGPDAVVAKLVEGTRAIGSAIPTAAELGRDGGVAVGTARNAVDLIVAEDVIDRVPGAALSCAARRSTSRCFGSLGCRTGSMPDPCPGRAS